MAPLVETFLFIFNTVVWFYETIVVLAVVASWLIVFGVLSTRNDMARQLVNMLDALTEPVFRRVRKVIPYVGGIDLSPIIVLVALQTISILVNRYAVMLFV